ncbi:MAG: DUF370 domain-containing protein [Anaerolinea sp.]|nr:DUF370 domain-containing protein [Anaerolinea sp.]
METDTNIRRFGPVSVGAGGAVAAQRVVAVGQADSAPVRRALRYAQEHGLLIDLTYGRQAQAVLFMDSGHVARIALNVEEFVERWRGHG